MGIAAARTVTLPANPVAPWDEFVWTGKYPSDELDYLVECTAWLNGGAIASVSYGAGGAVQIIRQSYVLTGNRQTGVLLRIAGGVYGFDAMVRLRLQLLDAVVRDVLVLLPILAPLADSLIGVVDVGVVTIGGRAPMIGGRTITIGGPAIDDGVTTIGGHTIAIGGRVITIGAS